MAGLLLLMRQRSFIVRREYTLLEFWMQDILRSVYCWHF